MTGKLVEAMESRSVDRRMWLADQANLATEPGMNGGQRARAGDELAAALHHDVGICADHRQAPGNPARDALAVVFGGLKLVIEETGAADDLGVGFSNELQPKALV